MALAHEFERGHGLDRVGEGVAGAGDAHDGEVGDFFQHDVEVVGGLAGGEDGAGDAGAALVHAVELPVAEVALDVAARGDGEVDAAVGVVRVLVEARVLGEIPGDGRRRRAEGLKGWGRQRAERLKG